MILLQQERNIVHGRIRCATIYVKDHERSDDNDNEQIENDSERLEIKLGDPGLKRPYTDNDIPWIPVEFLRDDENLETAKTEPKTDLWAFGTTLWEIFNYGSEPSINRRQIVDTNGRLPPPKKCITCRLKPNERCQCCRDIYEIMCEAWNEDPDQRCSPTTFISKLIAIRDRIQPDYTDPSNVTVMTCQTDVSARTLSTIVNGYVPNGTDMSERSSHSSGISTTNLLVTTNGCDDSEHSSGDLNGSDFSQECIPQSVAREYTTLINTCRRIDNREIRIKDKIGSVSIMCLLVISCVLIFVCVSG